MIGAAVQSKIARIQDVLIGCRDDVFIETANAAACIEAFSVPVLVGGNHHHQGVR